MVLHEQRIKRNTETSAETLYLWQ